MKTCPVFDLIYLDAGGGHRATANALQAQIIAEGRPWKTRLVNLFEVLDPRGTFRKTVGCNPEDIYNQRLKRGWTFGMAQELRLLQALIRLGDTVIARRMRQHWAESQPDLVVSLIPNFNRPLRNSLAWALPGVGYVTVLTDFADYPPNFWIERDLSIDYVCGTPAAVSQARLAGQPTSRIHATSGMVIHPNFYAPPLDDRAPRMRALGLDPARRTGLVLFGGQGSSSMVGIARRLHDTQLILVCGHNAKLAQALRALRADATHHVMGYVSDIARTMQLADFFIGKAGPGSLSEAVQQRLPVVVTSNAWTLPQERYNTRWVEERGLGIVLRSFRDVRAAVRDIQANFDDYLSNTFAINNRALFEVTDILERIYRRDSDCAPRLPTDSMVWRTTAPRGAPLHAA